MKKLAVLIFAIMLGIGVVSTGPNAWATSYDPTGEPGVWPVPPTTPMIWNQGGVGDMLYGDLYRAVIAKFDDPYQFATYVSIENLSGYWVAAHVRLRSGRYSIEVWDRLILLSPRDVFWFQLEVRPGFPHLNVELFSYDVGTLRHSGLIGANDTEYRINLDPDLLQQFRVLYPDRNAPEIWEEMTQGYIEVIGLWALPGAINGYPFPSATATGPGIMASLWGDQEVAGCYIGDTQFFNRPGYPYAPDQTYSKACAIDVQKFLMGHVFMADFSNGLYFGYPMHAIKDFRAGLGGHRDAFVRDGNPFVNFNGVGKPYPSSLILYSGYGLDAAYTEPDWATSFGPTLNDGDDFFGTGASVSDSFSIDEFEDAIFKQYVFGDYFNGGFSYGDTGPGEGGTFSLAAVLFVTKYHHYFYDAYSGLVDRINGIELVDIPRPYCSSTWDENYDCWVTGFEDKAAGVRAGMDLAYWVKGVGLSTGVWDLAERPAGFGSPFWQIELPWELNFVPIGDLSLDKLAPFCFLSVDDPTTPYSRATYGGGWFAGWFLMDSFQLLNDPLRSGGCRGYFDAAGAENWYWGGSGYCPEFFTLLYNGGAALLPPSGMVMDWDFTNFPHGRNYEFQWDNLTFRPGDPDVQIPVEYPWYGGAIILK